MLVWLASCETARLEAPVVFLRERGIMEPDKESKYINLTSQTNLDSGVDVTY